MKVVSVVTCRSESTRLYGKPMQLVGRLTILEWHVRQLQASRLCSTVVLAIADTPSMHAYIDFGRRNGLPCVVGSEQDVQLRMIWAGQSQDADLITRSTPDNPWICWEYLDLMIEAHMREGADLTSMWDIPYGSIIEVVSMKALERSRALCDPAMRSEAPTRGVRFNPEEFKILTIPHEEDIHWPGLCLTVDNPEELAFVRAIAEEMGLEEEPPRLRDIVRAVRESPRLAEMNRSIALSRGMTP